MVASSSYAIGQTRFKQHALMVNIGNFERGALRRFCLQLRGEAQQHACKGNEASACGPGDSSSSQNGVLCIL